MTIVVIVLGVLFFIIINGQVKLKKVNANNNKKFSDLADKVYELLYDCDQNEIKLGKIMSDSNKYYVLAAGKEDNSIALVSENDAIRLKKSSKNGFKFIINRINNDKEFDRIICRISSPDLEKPYDVYISEKKHRFNSYVGKLTTKNAESLKKMLLFLKFEDRK